MFSRINICKIIVDHIGTLRRINSKSEKIYWKDLTLFFILPFVFGLVLSWYDKSIAFYTPNLIAAVSIFGGFLFNLLAIIYSQIDKISSDAEKENSNLKQKFVKEIHINISYSIVLSILLVVVLILSTISLNEFDYKWLVVKFGMTVIYFLLLHFMLTLLMVINRVYILLKKKFNT